MKYYYCMALTLCFWGFGFSQSTQPRGTVGKLQPAKSSVSASPKTTALQSSDSLAGMTPEHCQNVIDAIDHKVAAVQSDQTQHEKALANGWYDLMARNRAAWVADRDELIRRRNASN